MLPCIPNCDGRIDYCDNKWCFDIYYDESKMNDELSGWMVRVAEGTEDYYRGIEQRIQDINRNKEPDDDDKKSLAFEKKKQIRLGHFENREPVELVLGSEPGMMALPFKRYIMVGTHRFELESYLWEDKADTRPKSPAPVATESSQQNPSDIITSGVDSLNLRSGGGSNVSVNVNVNVNVNVSP